MDLFYTDQFVLPLPETHRFPMTKYSLLRERIESEGVPAGVHLKIPDPVSDQALLTTHTPEYLESIKTGTIATTAMRRIGFPWSSFMVERSRRSVGATLQASRSALACGFGINLAGGTHHAFADRGEGYCVFNDAVVAARSLQAEGRVRRVVILDGDVHQGNGSAYLCSEDPSIYTFSIHGARNYPFRKEVSDLDIELDDGTTDGPYLAALERGLATAIDQARADFAIYLAGADPYVEDRYGRLAMTKRGLRARDQMVYDACQRAGLPVVLTMAGGYARNVDDIVDIHYATVRLFMGMEESQVASPKS